MLDLYSTSRIHRVCRFDGRTRIVQVRRGDDWERVQHGWGVPLSSTALRRLKYEGVAEVELSRWFSRARMPMSWLQRHFH